MLNTPGAALGCGDAVASLDLSPGSQERRALFDLFAQMRQNPGRFLPVIELMYLCISLGFQGRYRLSPRGPAELDRLREEGYALIARQRQGANPELSPHRRGVAAPYRAGLWTVPLWVAASVASERSRCSLPGLRSRSASLPTRSSYRCYDATDTNAQAGASG